MKGSRSFADFVSGNQGQSLTEHTLLIAFVAMLALSVFIAAGGRTRDIWSMGTSQLETANHTLAPSTASSPTQNSPAAPGTRNDEAAARPTSEQ